MPSFNDLQAQVAAGGVADSSVVRGTQTAPAGNAVIATVTPGAGVYQITVLAGYGATPDVADNMDIRLNGVTLFVLPVIAAANGNRIPLTFVKRIPAAQALTVNAVAGGGAGSIFNAHLILQRIAE